MKTYHRIFVLFVFFIAFYSCMKDEETDTEKPVIDLNLQDAFPVNCDTLYFGQSHTIRILLTDNKELGSFSIDIHNNFDHHSHTTEVNSCDLDPIKDPVNPWLIIQDYDIPAGLTNYTTDISFTIPSGNNDGLYDDGDYHFFISLTDKEGWSTQKGLSVKILH